MSVKRIERMNTDNYFNLYIKSDVYNKADF